jgi:hypothetical protein
MHVIHGNGTHAVLFVQQTFFRMNPLEDNCLFCVGKKAGRNGDEARSTDRQQNISIAAC